ncbi:hypothetical protein DSO57_1025099 [Entomophthora muscae]|uniref:Uncharacterized protein n=1 Tax=Entomophthora muscae TaxID=34485 RepID=A0ACC2TDJ8_9FUNG|nr:hypothetical protein DSO57_1025099 [Entomophthora muscae]
MYLFDKYRDVFAENNQDLGKALRVEHVLDTQGTVPICSRPIRRSLANQAIVNEELQKLPSAGLFVSQQDSLVFVVNAAIHTVLILLFCGFFDDKLLSFAFLFEMGLFPNWKNTIIHFPDSEHLTCPTHSCGNSIHIFVCAPSTLAPLSSHN